MKDRHQCEVRYVLKLRCESREMMLGYLYHNEISVQKKRGKEEADRLMREASDQWRMGNRGGWGDWRVREPITA